VKEKINIAIKDVFQFIVIFSMEAFLIERAIETDKPIPLLVNILFYVTTLALLALCLDGKIIITKTTTKD
jgi:hypothetical protein